MATCANHPIKMATTRCKTCNRPLCDECKRVTDSGVYCSPECESKAKHFAERAEGGSVTFKKRFFSGRTVRGLFILLMIAVLFGAYLYFFRGIRSLDDLWATLDYWGESWRLLLP